VRTIRYSVVLFLIFILASSSNSGFENDYENDYENPIIIVDEIEDAIDLDGTVTVGKGSYFDTLPAGAIGPPETIYKTNNLVGPIQTNDWVSSVLFQQYSSPLYAHPLAYLSTEDGFEVGFPHASGNGQYLHRADFTIKANLFSPSDARLDKMSDWFADISMANGNNELIATIGHGSPYAYFNLNNGDIKFDFEEPITILSSDSDFVHFKTNYGNVFAIFAPEESNWNGISSGSQSITLELGDTFFSLVGLPDDNTSTLNYYKNFAYSFVKDSKVTWEYNEDGILKSKYEIETEIKKGNEDKTVVALYPHQWRDNELNDYLEYSYDTIRGNMKTVEGNYFEIEYKYSGILPMLPSHQSFDNVLLSELMNEALANIKTNSCADTYWCGKEVGRLAQLLPIAEQIGDLASANVIIQTLKTEIQNWLTADNGEDYYYDKNWGTLIGYPASFGTDKDLNDHHFHYGYWIQAAAQIALRDKNWASDENWGGMINLLIRDIATNNRQDDMFPFLRNFDIYEGHSWASGNAIAYAGNNQESSSEAINAWAGLILWGEATNNDEVRDTGIYLYTTEVRAINNYYFDIHGDVFDESYNHEVSSLVWGGQYQYTTWFSGNAFMIHGILLLPITPASIYLGMDPNYVQRNYNEAHSIETEIVWADLMTEYLALSDPDKAIQRGIELGMWNVGGAFSVEEGESKAHSYHWVHNFAEMGLPNFEISSNYTFSNVFTKNLENTYVVYNSNDFPIKVQFSNGFITTEIEPNSLYTNTNSDGPSYYLNDKVYGEGRISPNLDKIPIGSLQTINAIPEDGWKFERWEGDYQGNENPISIKFDTNKTIYAIFVEETLNSNLAIGKDISSSSNENNQYIAEYANDGDMTTRWASAFSDNQWIKIDLGENYKADEIKLYWENAFALSYEVLVSNVSDGEWIKIIDVTENKGGENIIQIDEVEFRYVQINCKQRATEYGFSLYEIEVNINEDEFFHLYTDIIGGGGVTNKSGKYDYLEIINLEAFAFEGYEFSGWLIDAEGTGKMISVQMDDHKLIIANFTLIANQEIVDETSGTEELISSNAEELILSNTDSNFRTSIFGLAMVGTLVGINAILYRRNKILPK
jgi:endoglucanase Acf2